MEISVARKRLEEIRADLDRTVSVLLGEHHLVRGGGADPGDAGANLTEADKTRVKQINEQLSVLTSAFRQKLQGAFNGFNEIKINVFKDKFACFNF